jgi:hypothetical protein
LRVGQDDSGSDPVDAGSSLSRRKRRIKWSDNEVRARRTQQRDHKLDAVAGLHSDDVTGSQTMTQKRVAVVGYEVGQAGIRDRLALSSDDQRRRLRRGFCMAVDDVAQMP